MSAIEDFIIDVFNEYGIPLFENGSPFKKKQDAAYAELAELRAKADELDHIRALIPWAVLQKWQSVYDAVDATIAEQARQLVKARQLIDDCRGFNNYDFYSAAADWLTTNAPAQPAQRVTAEVENE